MRIKVLSGGRKNIELPLSDAELNFQMRRIGIEETVPICRLVEVSEQDNPLHKFEGQTVNMDEVNFFAKRMKSMTEYERKVLSAYAEDYGVATMKDLINLTFSMKGLSLLTDFSDARQVGERLYLDEFLGISEEEKADALAFYRSYFEDAGEENEESVIAELESPEKVAQSIKKNLGMEKENGSYDAPAGRKPEWNKNDDMFVKKTDAPKEKKGGWSAAAIILVVLTSPLWLTLLLVVASLLLAVVATLFGIAVAVVAVMASLVFAGFLLIGFGFSTLFTGGVAVGLGLTGAGLLVLGLGILAVLLVVWVFGVFLPWAVREMIRLCKKPFEKKKESGVAA